MTASRSTDLNHKLTVMREGGDKLRQIKQALEAFTQVGTGFESIEAEAQRLIREVGGKSNFAMVPGYHWATCIMKNDEMCHGIPQHKRVEDGDVITIDVGMLYQGWHLDTTISFGVGTVSVEAREFLAIGKKSLKKAINKVKPGVSVYEISKAMQQVVERAGYGAVYQLTGHGVGKELHMEPNIPCVAQRSDKRVKLTVGQTVAIEIMYSAGDPYLILDDDGWTYRTEDGSLAGMFEETVAVVEGGFEVLT